MMEENEMKEFSQIRERFLADARRHFLAGDATAGQLQNATRKNIDQCRSSAGEPRLGPASV